MNMLQQIKQAEKVYMQTGGLMFPADMTPNDFDVMRTIFQPFGQEVLDKIYYEEHRRLSASSVAIYHNYKNPIGAATAGVFLYVCIQTLPPHTLNRVLRIWCQAFKGFPEAMVDGFRQGIKNKETVFNSRKNHYNAELLLLEQNAITDLKIICDAMALGKYEDLMSQLQHNHPWRWRWECFKLSVTEFLAEHFNIHYDW